MRIVKPISKPEAAIINHFKPTAGVKEYTGVNSCLNNNMCGNNEYIKGSNAPDSGRGNTRCQIMGRKC